jgi:hypothetical protein
MTKALVMAEVVAEIQLRGVEPEIGQRGKLPLDAAATYI